MTTTVISAPGPSADATTAINTALGVGGGGYNKAILPAGQYCVPSYVTIPSLKNFAGEGNSATGLIDGAAQFDVNCFYGANEYMATNAARQYYTADYHGLLVNAGAVGCVGRDLRIYGSVYSALYTQGIDCHFENCEFARPGNNGAAVMSQGANWYIGCRLDSFSGHGSPSYGYYQTAGMSLSIMENHFTLCSIRGSYDYAVVVNDGNGLYPYTKFSNCDIGGHIYAGNSMWISTEACIIEGNVNNVGGQRCTVQACYSSAGRSNSNAWIDILNWNV